MSIVPKQCVSKFTAASRGLRCYSTPLVCISTASWPIPLDRLWRAMAHSTCFPPIKGSAFSGSRWWKLKSNVWGQNPQKREFGGPNSHFKLNLRNFRLKIRFNFETVSSIDTKFEHRLPVIKHTSWVVQRCQMIIQDGRQARFWISDWRAA